MTNARIAGSCHCTPAPPIRCLPHPCTSGGVVLLGCTTSARWKTFLLTLAHRACGPRHDCVARAVFFCVTSPVQVFLAPSDDTTTLEVLKDRFALALPEFTVVEQDERPFTLEASVKSGLSRPGLPCAFSRNLSHVAGAGDDSPGAAEAVVIRVKLFKEDLAPPAVLNYVLLAPCDWPPELAFVHTVGIVWS